MEKKEFLKNLEDIRSKVNKAAIDQFKDKRGKYGHIKLDEIEQEMINAGLDFLFEDITDDGDGVLQLTEQGRKIKEFFREVFVKGRRMGRSEAFRDIHQEGVEKYGEFVIEGGYTRLREIEEVVV